MKLMNEHICIASLVLLIAIIPFFPTALLLSLDSIVIRFAVIIGLLYAISQGPIIGLLTLFAVGLLYLERNRRKVLVAQKKIDKMDTAMASGPMSTVEEGVPQKTVPVVPFEEPSGVDVYYVPTKENEPEFFETVGKSINEKTVQTVVPNGEKAADIFEESGFGHIMH